jgi:DNA-binding ferritin-like protein
MSVIAESNDQPDAMTMIAILAQDAVKMAELCSMVFRIAEEVGEHGYADFLAGRQDAYRKHAWMLRSTLK